MANQSTQVLKFKFLFLCWASLLLLVAVVQAGTAAAAGPADKNDNISSRSRSSSSGSTSYSDSTSCQCGVFLLGAPPLQFSEDAKPVLAGDPVSTNCTSPKDRTDCSTICRRLIQSMDNPKSPLFQAVVLTASRTLACQRSNMSVSLKVPLPRIHMNSPWTRNIGGGDNNGNSKRETTLMENEPKWLGGFYRWCDVHWIYAGASVHEPLCCSNGFPTKCPENSNNNNFPTSSGVRSTVPHEAAGGNKKNSGLFFSGSRNPRLIIKKRPEDDLSEEETDDEEELAGGGEQDNNDLTETSSSSPLTTVAGGGGDDDDEVDDEANAANENENSNTSFEKIDPLKVVEAGEDSSASSASKLNSTILAEAFQFVGAIMRTLGFGDVTDGINTVLPSSTATELLKKVDVGGWVGKYQDQYVRWGREYNLGYCYLEYGLYNVASEGVGNVISRVFGGGSGSSGNGIGNSILGGNNNNNIMNNNIMNSNLIKTYHRRVRRSSGFDEAVGAAHTGENSNNATAAAVPATVSKPSKIHVQNSHVRPSSASAQKVKSSRRQQPSGPNLMNMANMFLQMATAGNDNGGGGGGGGGGGDVNSVLQNALPLLGQVATSPMIQGVVSNLVTSFLTPPDPLSNNNHFRPPSKNGLEENEIEQIPSQSIKYPQRPQQPPPQQQQESGLTSMLGQIVQTYLKHYFSSGPSNTNTNSNNKHPVKHEPSSSSSSHHRPSKNPSSSSITTTAAPVAEEKTDIVETISEVAKPFFLSYFGVVPGSPGFGQLNVADRTGRDTLSYDPDPGSSLSDLFFGSVNIPATGNSLFDFGNRISFAFGRANDPTQGLFCFKQYTVNKLWDTFRFGVKTLFK